MVIKFQYAGEERQIKFDGRCFMPIDTSLVINKKSGEASEGDRAAAYFKEFGNAVNWIIKNSMGSKEEEVSLLAFVTRYELAVKEIVSLKEEDFEF